MTIREHAKQLIEAECDMLSRERRSMGVPYPARCRDDDKAGIKKRVRKQLKESGKYDTKVGNVQLIVFILFSLARLIVEIIAARNKNKETWGQSKSVNNEGGA